MLSWLVFMFMIFIYFILKTLIMLSWLKSLILLLAYFLVMIWLSMELLFKLIWHKKFLSYFILFNITIFLMSKNLWIVYLMYESVMIPMILMLMGWGLNPYRFNALMYLLIYSSLLSMPSMMIILLNYKFMMNLSLNLKNHSLSTISSMILMLMFLVKSPVFFLHNWLPKAHVEASTMGSMILASGLLKMGSMGALKLMFWLNMHMKNLSFFMWGIMICSFICLIQTDFKKLAAMTSVIHMSLSILMILLIKSNSSLQAFMLINLTHTLVSGALFYMSGLLFKFSKTRLIYFQGFMKFNLLFILLILIIFMNLGTPPYVSFLSEILSYSCIVNYSSMSFKFLLVLMVNSLLYSLLLMNNMKFKKFLSLKFLSVIIVTNLGSPLFLMWWLF